MKSQAASSPPQSRLALKPPNVTTNNPLHSDTTSNTPQVSFQQNAKTRIFDKFQRAESHGFNFERPANRERISQDCLRFVRRTQQCLQSGKQTPKRVPVQDIRAYKLKSTHPHIFLNLTIKPQSGKGY